MSLGLIEYALLPEPEVVGLLALMLSHESRRHARISEQGELIPLEAQDRSLWQQDEIVKGVALVQRAVLQARY